jgi:hypothetical protein
MTNAVVYYRTRPSEAESDLALLLQRKAVGDLVAGGQCIISAEFVEHESEDNKELPAFAAAVLAAHALGEEEDSMGTLIVASRAGIGSGPPLSEPHIYIKGGKGVLYYWLDATLIPVPAEIALPRAAPAPLTLYAHYRPTQLDTLVYLCNAGPGPLAELRATIDHISMNQFYTSAPSKRWAEINSTQQERWNAVSSNSCVLINTLSHNIWDEVSRYRLSFTDTAGQGWTAEADDLSLNACRLAQDPNEVWVPLYPVRAETGITYSSNE